MKEKSEALSKELKVANGDNQTDLVTNCDRSVAVVESKILRFRGQYVMIDRDLAELYNVETKVLNQAVKRNINRFPTSFRFQLSLDEKDELVTNCDRFKNLKHSSVNPYAFTEQGVAMLSAVLKSDTAVKVSIRIMEAFVAMRNFLMDNVSVFQRLDRVELRQLKTEEKVDAILNRLNQNTTSMHGIFFNGQFFDAYKLMADLIREARIRIVLIDNYVDDTVLQQLDKRSTGVAATIYTPLNKTIRQDVDVHNRQYPAIELIDYRKAHDRFLIIDETVYHIGASLKDLGRKLFAFNRMDVMTGSELLAQL